MLIRAGLLEEVHANGSLLAWRRDAEAGPMALRITKQGLEAIGAKDIATGALTETSGSAASHRTEVEAPAVKVVASRKRASVCKADVRSHEASDGQGEDQSRLLARKPARVETSSRARHAGPRGGSNDCCHHACHPLATALGPRLLRRGGSQEARPRTALGETRWR